MKYFIIETNLENYLVIAENKEKAQIKFSISNPSSKIRKISETNNEIFTILI